MKSIFLIVFLIVSIFNILCIEAQFLNILRSLQANSKPIVYTNTKNNLRGYQQPVARTVRQQPAIRFVQQQQQPVTQQRAQQRPQLQQAAVKARRVRQPQQIIIVDQRQPAQQQRPQAQQRKVQAQPQVKKAKQPQNQQQQRQPQGLVQTQTRPQQRPRQQNQQQQAPTRQQTQQPQRQQQPQQQVPTRQHVQRQQQQQQAPARQQTQPQPQRQQSVQRQPQQQAAVVTFPGETNRPRPTNQNAGFSQANNPFMTSNAGPNTFTQSFATTSDGFVTASSSSSSSFGGNTFNNGGFGFINNQDNFNNGFNGFNGDGSNGFINSQNNFDQFGAGSNQFNRRPFPGFNRGDGSNNFGGQVDQFNQFNWYGPHRPRSNHYRDFAQIFNEIDRKAESDYNQSAEEDEMNDDFNGRSVVSPGQYPHMTALGYRASNGETIFKCGGSLISEMFVLTAAHCCFLNGQAPHLVKIGDIKLKEFERYLIPQRRGIARVHQHPLYNTSLYYNDIGLLELTNPIEYTYFVRPIRLWARDEIPYDKVFTMGYGSTSFAQAPTNVLTELDLSVVSLDSCNSTMPMDPSAPYGIADSQICAKDYEKNRDTCQGDSGGPLQLNLERPRRRRLRYYLVGIISYGASCRSQYPGVYTRVSSYIDWIASVVWPTYFNNFQ